MHDYFILISIGAHMAADADARLSPTGVVPPPPPAPGFERESPRWLALIAAAADAIATRHDSSARGELPVTAPAARAALSASSDLSSLAVDAAAAATMAAWSTDMTDETELRRYGWPARLSVSCIVAIGIAALESAAGGSTAAPPAWACTYCDMGPAAPDAAEVKLNAARSTELTEPRLPLVELETFRCATWELRWGWRAAGRPSLAERGVLVPHDHCIDVLQNGAQRRRTAWRAALAAALRHRLGHPARHGDGDGGAEPLRLLRGVPLRAHLLLLPHQPELACDLRCPTRASHTPPRELCLIGVWRCGVISTVAVRIDIALAGVGRGRRRDRGCAG